MPFSTGIGGVGAVYELLLVYAGPGAVVYGHAAKSGFLRSAARSDAEVLVMDYYTGYMKEISAIWWMSS
jgi:hypothetical protein